VNPATVRATRATKIPAFTEASTRDLKDRLQDRLVAIDDHLLRRWERIAREPRA